MSKNSRGFAPILIVVILGAIGIIGYLVVAQSAKQSQPTPSSATQESIQQPPENWKTYTDSQYNYSIQYPDNLLPEKSSNDIYLSFVSFGNLSDEQNPWFSVSVRDTKLEDEVKFVKWQSSHSLVTLVKEEEITMNGYAAVRLEYEPQRPDVGKPDTYIIVNNGKYSFTLYAETESIDQILSTFQFLE